MASTFRFSGLFSKFRQLSSHGHPLRPLMAVAYWLPTAIVFNNYCYTIKLVTGRSMQPTLNPDSSLWRDLVVFDRLSIRTLHQYGRGDIVALWSPTHPDRMLVKRIIAVEGDEVKTLPPCPEPFVRIPPGFVWVEGDEPFRTTDSNSFGPVPVALLDSKLTFIVWPWERIGQLNPPKEDSGLHLQPSDPRRRAAMARLEREQWRASRVKIASVETS